MDKKAIWSIGGVLLLALTLPSLSQQTNAIRYVNHADPTCQNHTPCYPTIAAALVNVP